MLMDSENLPQDEQTADFFVPNEPEATQSPVSSDTESVSWSASEFMNHQKSPFWYVIAAGVLLSIGLIFYLLMDELFGPIAVIVLGSLLLIGASRKPRTLDYLVDEHGIVVGHREYVYDDFQSFAIIKEDSVESIMLMPQKRWSPTLTIYFDPTDGQKIFNVLSTYLPLEERQKDSIDKFLHKIRF